MHINKLWILGAATAVLALAGCDGGGPVVPLIDPLPGFDSVRQAAVSYQLTLVGGGGQWTLDLTAAIHNTTKTRRTLTYGALCPVILEAFPSSAPTGTPAWSEIGRPGACKSSLKTDTIAPGDSLILHGTHTTTNEILAHYGLAPINPPGQYLFYAFVNASTWTPDRTRRLVGFSQLSNP